MSTVKKKDSTLETQAIPIAMRNLKEIDTRKRNRNMFGSANTDSVRTCPSASPRVAAVSCNAAGISHWAVTIVGVVCV